MSTHTPRQQPVAQLASEEDSSVWLMLEADTWLEATIMSAALDDDGSASEFELFVENIGVNQTAANTIVRPIRCGASVTVTAVGKVHTASLGQSSRLSCPNILRIWWRPTLALLLPCFICSKAPYTDPKP